MSHAAARSRESAVPTQPSNRKIIEQMEKWGWTIVATGNMYVMEPPLGGRHLHLRAPNLRNSNSSMVMRDVYRLTSDGDSDLFWRGPSELWLELVQVHREEVAAKKAAATKDAERRLEEAAQRAAQAHQAQAQPPVLHFDDPDPTPEPVSEPVADEDESQEEPTKRPYPKGRVYGRVRDSDVLEAFRPRGKTVLSIAMIAYRIGLDVSDANNKKALARHLRKMADEGKLTSSRADHASRLL